LNETEHFIMGCALEARADPKAALENIKPLMGREWARDSYGELITTLVGALAAAGAKDPDAARSAAARIARRLL